MADAIGALYVSLGLDSAAFSAGIKRVQSQARAMADSLGKIAGGALAAAAPAMAAIGVAAANMGAEIQRAAQLANAAPEEFQGWAAGAKSVGIEQEKLADILKDVNDRVGDFISTGGGPMKDFFDVIGPKVGVTAEQFRNLSGPQALQLYVDSLQKANVNQQDFTFYMEAMASDSTALLPLLRDGGKGMAEYAAKAASLGLILDNKTTAAFARAKQSFSDVMSVFAGFRNIIAEQVVPPMAAMADAFVNASRQGSLIGDTVRAIAEQIPRMTAYVTAFLAVIGAKWAAAFIAARVATFSLVGALAALRGAIAATGIGLLAVAIGEVVYRISEWVAATGGLAAAWYTMKAKFLEVLRQMAGAWVEFTWSIADGMNGIFGTSFSGADAGITQMLGSMQIAAEDAAAAARDIGVAASEASSGLSALGLAGQTAGEQASSGVKKVREEVEKIDPATERAKEKIEDFFGSFLDGIDSAIQGLADLLSEIAKVQFSKGAMSLLGMTSWGGGLIDLVKSGLGANANGTNNWRGGLTRINERGGEIVDLPSGTRIIPHDVSNRMMDGAGAAYGVQLGASSMTLTDDGRLMAQVDAKIVRMGQAVSKSIPSQIQAYNKNPRKR